MQRRRRRRRGRERKRKRGILGAKKEKEYSIYIIFIIRGEIKGSLENLAVMVICAVSWLPIIGSVSSSKKHAFYFTSTLQTK
jgi:hypothetical protein